MKQKLIHLLEKVLKTDVRYLTKGGFWLMIGHIFFLATNLIMTVAFANMLPLAMYGTYQFVMSTGSILRSFTLTGMGLSIKRAVAKGSNGALRHGFKKQLLWSTGIVIASGTLSIYYFSQSNNILAVSFLFVGACAPLIEAFTLYRSYLLGKKLFKETTLLGFWRKPFTVLSLLIALYFTDNPAILVGVFYISSIISLGTLYFLTVRRYNLPTTHEKEMIEYSKKLSAIGIIRTVANNIDKILIFQFLGAAHVAIYSIAHLPLLHSQKIFGLLGHLVFPKFVERTYESIQKNILHKLIVLFLVALMAIVTYVVLAPYVYYILFPEYAESIFISQILILALLFKPATLFGQVFEAHKMIRVQQFSIISSLSLKIILLFVLLQLYGMWGAVYATLITNIYWAFVTGTLFYMKKNKK